VKAPFSFSRDYYGTQLSAHPARGGVPHLVSLERSIALISDSRLKQPLSMAGAVRRLDCWRGDFNARCLGAVPSRWLPLEEKAEIKSVLNELP
jgi:hypothetical protein